MVLKINYHLRAPHPLYFGFDQRLKDLNDSALYQTVLDYETYALDLQTGDLDRSRPGGYTYVTQVFGRKPVVVSPLNGNPRISNTAQRVYASLGAQMVMIYHEEGTKVERPFEYVNNLLVRPSDFSVLRVTSIDGTNNFWWRYMTEPNASKYKPTTLLQSQLTEWESHNYGRAPFITAIIHENDFFRSGDEGWSAYFYKMVNGRRTTPLTPPFDLNAPVIANRRTEAAKTAIFAAYEELVARTTMDSYTGIGWRR